MRKKNLAYKFMLGNETGLLVKFSRQLIVKLDKLLVKKKK